jgi:predicted DNA-binding transcriptional regulator YafY
MRADRLLSLVLLLRVRGRMTATELARELEVSTRTVLRDIDALSTAGIPVYAERGRQGGFALLPGFSTDLTGLTPDEAVALLTARSAATSDALGLGAAFASAMRKVVAALPTSSRADAVDAADRVLVRPGGWLADPVPEPQLAAVQRAVFAGRRLRLRYPSPGAAPRWRTVDPLGLVSAAGRWYLLAQHDGADRTYRVSRIDEAVELDEPARRPAGVDLEQFWQRRRAEFQASRGGLRVRARVRRERWDELAATALDLAATATGPETETDGWLTVEASFGDHRHAESALWAVAPDAEALDPPELRAALAARAAAVAARHR